MAAKETIRAGWIGLIIWEIFAFAAGMFLDFDVPHNVLTWKLLYIGGFVYYLGMVIWSAYISKKRLGSAVFGCRAIFGASLIGGIIFACYPYPREYSGRAVNRFHRFWPISIIYYFGCGIMILFMAGVFLFGRTASAVGEILPASEDGTYTGCVIAKVEWRLQQAVQNTAIPLNLTALGGEAALARLREQINGDIAQCRQKYPADNFATERYQKAIATYTKLLGRP